MGIINFLYTTAPDKAVAGMIARALIEARLSACVNIIEGMTSVYRWQGVVATGSETVMIVKTTADAAPKARDLILERHPYETPCVIAFSADDAGSNSGFVEWIAGEVCP